MPQFTPEAIDKNAELLKLLHQLANDKQATPAQISLAWMLSKKSYIVPIPGTRKWDRMKENAEAVNIQLKKEEVDAIDKALDTMEMSAVFGSTAIKERK